MQGHFSRGSSLAFAVLALGVHGLWAHDVSAAIRGTITDPSGATVTDAIVTITDVTKGWSRKMVTGANGDYQFAQLIPADTFALAVEAAAFRKEVRAGIVLKTGQQSRVDLQLLSGSVIDSVMVEDAASLVDTENASVGAVVDERKVEELPLNGRQFCQLYQLVPSVLPPTQNSSIGFRGGFNFGGVDNADQATLRPNFGLPVNDASSSSFGHVTLTSASSRELQFGLQLLF
jgi:Carboxypeptidase regulatory-like domain